MTLRGKGRAIVMKAPVRMVCRACGAVIGKGDPIERIPNQPDVRYKHVGCGPGNPPAPVPKGGPAPHAPVPVPGGGPKGWVTEDKFALPADALKRLHGQDAPHDNPDAKPAREELDGRIDNPEEGDAGGEIDPRSGYGDDKSEGGRAGKSDGDVPDLFEDIPGGEDGAGTEGGEDGDADGGGDGEAESDGDGEDGDGDKQDGDASESEGGEEETGEGDKPGDKGKKETPEKSGKLEDLPDELLLRLAMLAAEMAHAKLKGSVEPRLAKMLAEAAEPLTAKMASEFQTRMGESVRGELKRSVEVTRKDAERTIKELRAEIDKRVQEECSRLDNMRPVVHKIERADGSFEFGKDELFHFAFDESLKLAGAGFDGFWPGPTGAGKSHMAGQIATALGLDFAMISGTGGVTETEILGNSTPNLMTGEQVYQETGFVRVYENGGLFLLDEADAMDANVFLKVNAAIANGYCPVPKRHKSPVAKRHKNFIFWMAANTWGHGATRLYCGRNKLDEATLDRVRAATVPMDYDPNLERRLVGDQELYRTLAGWRAKITEHGLQRVLSTRFMLHAKKLKALGYDTNGVAKKLVGGWTAGEIHKVIGRAV